MKVVVVEDNASTQILLEQILTARGHEVTCFADAEGALAECEKDLAPLIVLDWQLPAMDGLQLCRRIRELPLGDRCFLLMVTARDRPEDLKAVLQAGADDYVPKPIDVEALDIRFAIAERQVDNLLERKRAEAELAKAMTNVARSRDDMLSILNKLQVGTVMSEPDGKLGFLSKSAELLLGRSADSLSGQPWESALPLDESDRAELAAVVARPEAERDKISAVVEKAGGARSWVEIEVRDDPRDRRGKIFVLDDVSDLHALRQLLNEKAQFHDLVGGSKPMQQVYELIGQVAGVDSTVLIEGETGTGKELVARALHYESHRRDRPFIAVNCAGLTESILASQLFGHKRGSFTGAVDDHQGYFEAAHTGTLFLDEIGDVSPSVQTSLLRVLQEREILRLGETKPRKVDVRILAATHHDLARDAADGTFRSDLLYRIRVARIRLPPLRDRREDIPALASAFLAQSRASTGKNIRGVSQPAMGKLLSYSWPGNVREMRSAIEFAAIRSADLAIALDDLPPEILASLPSTTPLQAPGNEEDRIRHALEQAAGNRSVAARLLGISRATLYRRLAALGMTEGKT